MNSITAAPASIRASGRRPEQIQAIFTIQIAASMRST
jgi:hypothetical protein